jgi:hypothetical protein
MTETPTRRGRPRGVESQHVMVRMPVDLIAQIDAYAASLQERIGISDVTISRGMAIRELVKRGLQSMQAGLPQAPPYQAPQPPSHPATVDEPEPMAAPASPMAVPQTPAAPSPEAAPVEEVPQSTKLPMIPTGMHQCRSGHEPYPMSRKECPTCVRNRKQRQRQRQKEPA